MMVSSRGSVLGLLAWQWKHVVFFVLASAAMVLLHQRTGARLPTVPLAVVGAALGIFVSFRTNQAYARWWEGRQLWGRIVNGSRHFTAQVCAYVTDPQAQRALVRRQIAFAHALRCALRDQDVHADKDYTAFADEDLKAERNVPTALMHKQVQQLAEHVDGSRLHAADQTLLTIVDAQGGCERIKRTPMPRGYGFIAERLLIAYAIVFPLCVVQELMWWTVPVTLLVCMGFALISEAGRVLEDPFTLFYNGLPLGALATTIEINLRQRLGETNLPPAPVPNANGILM